MGPMARSVSRKKGTGLCRWNSPPSARYLTFGINRNLIKQSSVPLWAGTQEGFLGSRSAVLSHAVSVLFSWTQTSCVFPEHQGAITALSQREDADESRIRAYKTQGQARKPGKHMIRVSFCRIRLFSFVND